MTLWILLIAAFVLQEPVVASAVMLAAYQHGYSPVAISIVFFAATAFDAAAGYALGHVLQQRIKHTRLNAWLVHRAKRFDEVVGTHGRRMALLVWGPIFFPFSAIVAPWFGYTFAENLWLSLIGDTVLWYGSLWLVVLGVHTIVPNPIWALFVVAGVTLLGVWALNHIAARR